VNEPLAQPVATLRRPSPFNIPNALTALRILAIPGVVLLLNGHSTPKDQFWAAVLFGLAFFTDYFDGLIARKTQAITRLGRIMDPIADKLLVLSALLMLVHMGRVPVIIAIVLIGREVSVAGLRNLASDEGITILSRFSGKLKTTFEGFGLGFLLAGPENQFWGDRLMNPGILLIYLALITALWSGTRYFWDYWKAAPKP
jgi:CDP-diacylglycerol---glycerol-3-phosphate 3-phosphatidyltransferase